MGTTRPRAGVKYGTASQTKIFSCPDGHVHLVGEDDEGIPEYEIVLGPTLIEYVEEAIHEVREGPTLCCYPPARNGRPS